MPNKDSSNMAKPRKRIVVGPEEMGLTSRIRRALLDPQFGLTMRIQRAMKKTKDTKSMFYLHKNHLVLLGLFLAIIAYLVFMQRDVVIKVVRQDGTIAISETAKVSFWGKELELEAPPQKIDYQRVDIYGNKLESEDFKVYKGSEPVPDKYRLHPGEYRLEVHKKGFKPLTKRFSVGKDQKVLLNLEPTITPSVKVTFLIEDELQPDAQILPDEVLIEGTEKSIKDGFIRPGEYTVRVSKRGYITKTFNFTVEKSGQIQKFKLPPKNRPITFIANDALQTQLTEEDIELRKPDGTVVPFDGKTIRPGHYEFAVNRDGFEPFKDKLTILPGPDPITKRLPIDPIPRKIVVHPSYDAPPDTTEPDKCFLKQLGTSAGSQKVIPIKVGTRVNPGRYLLTVEKRGYLTVKKEITILPSSAPYEERVSLISLSMLLALKIESDFIPNPKVEPDELNATFEVRKKGYYPAKVSPPLKPTAKTQRVPIDMRTIPRKVIAIITSDVVPDPIIPDSISLTSTEHKGDPVAIDGQKVFKPGKYLLNIRKVGYNPVSEEIIIYPDEGDFILKKKLTAMARKLEYQIDSDYRPDVWITPDRVTVNDRKDLEEDVSLQPGTYSLILKKNGYEDLHQEIEIKPGTKPFLVKGRFISKLRRLAYDIKDETGNKLDNYEVTFGDTPYREGDRIKPGAYNVKVKKIGYEAWSKDATIEPAEMAYTLSATLIAKPREIDLQVTATFPIDEPIVPDRAMLNQTRIEPGVGFKPGKYTLTIAKSGYQTIKEAIVIEPAEVPFPIHRRMEPTPRKVHLILSVDVEPEEPTNYQVTMRPVGGQGSFLVADGKAIKPDEYELLITRPGYQDIKRTEKVMPGVRPYEIKATLQALPRQVMVLVTADFPPGRLQADKVSLGNYDLLKPTKVPPGAYDLNIIKAGYDPVSDPVRIPAGVGPYKISRKLNCMDRLVAYDIRDLDSHEPLTPSSVTLDGTQVTGNRRFRPKANYALKIVVPGYNALQERMTLPAGEGTYVIKRELSSAMRLVTYQIDGDFEPGKPIEPQEFTLSGLRVDGNRSFRPGEHELLIVHPGYERVTDKLTLKSGRTPYEIRRTLVSKKRKVLFDIQGDYPPGVKITPDKVTIGSTVVREGDLIKPGRYAVFIQKEGFDECELKLVIPPSEEDFLLSARLVSRPRKVTFEITGDYLPGVTIEPDAITLGTAQVKGSAVVRPGEYDVLIEKSGYKPARFKEVISPGVRPHIIKRELISLPRVVEVTVTGDYPPDQELSPEVITSLTLDDRDIKTNEFKPRRGYQLKIAARGYGGLEEKLDLPPGVGPFKLTRRLESLARRLVFKISYDVSPPLNLGRKRITIEDIKTRRKRFIRSDNEMVRPGEYRLLIQKPAYHTIDEKLRIWPGEGPKVVERTMHAKAVLLRIKVTHDIRPPARLKSYSVTLIDEDDQPRNVEDGKSILPGRYKLEIKQPGYEMVHKGKRLNIVPSEKPFYINEELRALPRQLSFDMTDGEIMIKAQQILLNGKKVKGEDRFAPGKTYEIEAQFLQYETVRTKVLIEPGKGPFVAKIPLRKLKVFEFKITLGTSGEEIDGQTYRVKIFTDGREVELHHIKTENFGRSIFFKIYALPDTRTVRVEHGYNYSEKNIESLHKFGRLDRIDGHRLIEHLKSINPSVALRRMERLVKQRREYAKIKRLNRSELSDLISYVSNNFNSGRRRRKILEALRRAR